MVRLCGIILFIFSFPAFSQSAISIEVGTTEYGVLQYALILEGKKLKVVKNTNQFDNSNDIGEFLIENEKDIRTELELFKDRYNALVKVESLTQESPVSANAFKHQNYIKLGKYKVHPNDSYYPDLKKAFIELTKKAVLKSVDSLEALKDNEKDCQKQDNDKIKCLSSKYGILF